MQNQEIISYTDLIEQVAGRERGIECIGEIVHELREWLEENEYQSVQQIKGSMSLGNCPDPSAFARANYMKTLVDFAAER